MRGDGPFSNVRSELSPQAQRILEVAREKGFEVDVAKDNQAILIETQQGPIRLAPTRKSRISAAAPGWASKKKKKKKKKGASRCDQQKTPHSNSAPSPDQIEVDPAPPQEGDADPHCRRRTRYAAMVASMRRCARQPRQARPGSRARSAPAPGAARQSGSTRDQHQAGAVRLAIRNDQAPSAGKSRLHAEAHAVPVAVERSARPPSRSGRRRRTRSSVRRSTSEAERQDSREHRGDRRRMAERDRRQATSSTMRRCCDAGRARPRTASPWPG